MFLENLVRYSPYFLHTPDFTITVSNVIFSEKAILSKDH